MRLSFNMEYFGECREVIKFYMSVFADATAEIQTYREMPTASAFEISEKGFDMVWKSSLIIPFGKSSLLLELSDSLLIAMDKKLSFNRQIYNPVICLTHSDEKVVRALFEKLYGTEHSFEELKSGDIADRYGIRWAYEEGEDRGIYYCLTFDGFCSEAVAYYEVAFDINATDVVSYEDSPCADKVSGAGGDKIYSAILPFQQGERVYALRLRDSLESAVNNINSYDPKALLFYHKLYNPIFTFKDSDTAYLTESFDRLSIGAKLNKGMEVNGVSDVNGSLIDRYGICWNFYSL